MSIPNLEAYFARVDAHLAEIGPAEGRAFIEQLTEQWIKRYRDFQQRGHRRAPTRGSATAFDFINTLAGLDQRASNATRDACGEVRRWQEAYRKNREYRAAERAE